MTLSLTLAFDNGLVEPILRRQGYSRKIQFANLSSSTDSRCIPWTRRYLVSLMP
jgi:hypothetical protein